MNLRGKAAALLGCKPSELRVQHTPGKVRVGRRVAGSATTTEEQRLEPGQGFDDRFPTGEGMTLLDAVIDLARNIEHARSSDPGYFHDGSL